VFLINSRLGLFSATLSLESPLSRSYGVILPSSLTRVISRVFGFSPRPPVSVYGTGTIIINHRSFSWKCGFTQVASSLFKVLSRGFAYVNLFELKPIISTDWPRLASSVTPSVIIVVQEYQPVVHRLRSSA
jgi:hypothetical protein